MCAASRYVLLAWLAGMIATTVTGSDAIGWLAAGLVVALAVGLSRWFPDRFATSCPLPPPSAREVRADEEPAARTPR